MQIEQSHNSVWSLQDLPNLDDKIIVITGSSSGIGFEATKIFLQAGAQVIMACRNSVKTSEKIKELAVENFPGQVTFMELDLANLKSIHAFSENITKNLDHIDVLINNAGIMTVPYKNYAETVDGFGLTKTNLPYNGPAITHSNPSRLMRLIYKTAQSSLTGSLPIVYASTGSDIQGGDYIVPSKFFETYGPPKKVQSSDSSYDLENASKLWSISEQLTSISYLQ